MLDAIWPTRQQPAPDLDSASETAVVLARGAAAAIDLLVCYVFVVIPVFYGISELFPAEFEALGSGAIWLSVLVLVPVFITYAFAFEWHFGRTPGKVNRRLIVVMADGRPCTGRASALRNIAMYIDLLGIPPLVVGLVSALVADGQRIGDQIAGTVVVRSIPRDDVDYVVTGEMDTSATTRAASADEE